MFTTGQTVIINHFDSSDPDNRVFIGSEEAEILGVVADRPGFVRVRPFHSDDEIRVHVRDITTPTDVEDALDAAIHDELDRFGF